MVTIVTCGLSGFPERAVSKDILEENDIKQFNSCPPYTRGLVTSVTVLFIIT